MTRIDLFPAGRFCSGILACILLLLSLCGCVNQHPENESAGARGQALAVEDSAAPQEASFAGGETAEPGNDSSAEEEMAEPEGDLLKEEYSAAVEAAKAKVEGLGRDARIIATSPATVEICDQLNLDLVGVCDSSTSALPSRYEGAVKVGAAMSPDMEIVSSLSPDWILSPASLQSDLQPQYEALSTDWAFLNLKSVQGMYRSIQELGEIFDREEEAGSLVQEFTDFYEAYNEKNEGKARPRVLILMGLPGSYIIATPHSYVGSLVEMAGGENVYSDTDQEFLTVNTEDMKTKEPDVILRAAHALPEQVAEMFADEFSQNDIWKHFTAVQEGRVYDLSYDKFGMSASFNYPEALEELQPMLYPEEDSAEGEEASNG